MEVAKEKLSNFPSCKTCPTKPTTPWQFFVPFLGWLSDLLERLSDLQLGDKKVTLNHLAKRSFSGHMKNINPKKCTIHSGINPRHAETWKMDPEGYSSNRYVIVLPEAVLNEIPFVKKMPATQRPFEKSTFHTPSICCGILEKNSPIKRMFVHFPWQFMHAKKGHLPLPTHQISADHTSWHPTS